VKIAILAACIALSGCALNIRLLEDGKVHQGTMDYAGGRMAVNIEGDAYAGPISRGVSTAFTNGFIGRRPTFGSTLLISDQFQGLLTNKDGRILRCAIQSAGGRGQGLCQMNDGRTFDVIVGGDDPRGTFAK